MIVSVTGTRYGMTEAQRTTFNRLIESSCSPTEFHHGDCQGVDDESASIANLLMPRPHIVGHPGPKDDPWRAHNQCTDEWKEGKNHFARNRDLVDVCDLLIVCPREMERQERGGTWYTHDYATRKGKRLVIVWPDGALKGSP